LGDDPLRLSAKFSHLSEISLESTPVPGLFLPE